MSSILSKLKDNLHLKPFLGELKTASSKKKKEPIPVPKPPKDEEK